MHYVGGTACLYAFNNGLNTLEDFPAVSTGTEQAKKEMRKGVFSLEWIELEDDVSHNNELNFLLLF